MYQHFPFDVSALPNSAYMQEIKAALQNGFDALPEADQAKAKARALSMVLGDQEATEEFHRVFLIWFPLSLPPLTPIIWEPQEPGVTTSSVAWVLSSSALVSCFCTE